MRWPYTRGVNNPDSVAPESRRWKRLPLAVENETGALCLSFEFRGTMISNEPEPILRKSRLLGGLVITFVLGSVLGIWLVNRYVEFETEVTDGTQAILVRTPLGSLTPHDSQGAFHAMGRGLSELYMG